MSQDLRETEADWIISMLESAQELMRRYEDVCDGSDGRQLPNDAMTATGLLDEVINVLEKAKRHGKTTVSAD